MWVATFTRSNRSATADFSTPMKISSLSFRVVTRPQQNNDTQRWLLLDFGGGFFTIQQVSSGRFLEATLDGDFQVVTRAAPDSNQTVWRLGVA